MDHLFALDRLRDAIGLVVRGFGSDEAEVAAVADNLIEANLRGHDSHGIGMLPRYAEAFRDYANLLLTSPRYAGVVAAQDPAAFARGLQQAGYATDPLYAAKLERIIGGNTLRTALAG